MVWLERLLNSFEITKKLGSSKTNPGYVACFAYFSVSLCLALIGLKSIEYRHESVGGLESRKYLKILNGLIKSNDVLCFYINQKEYGFLSELKNKSQALNYAYLALVFELDTIKELSEQKNVI